MIMNYMASLVSLALVAMVVGPLGVTSKVTIVDTVDIQSIAEFVCKTVKADGPQVARISTIQRVKEYFDKLPEGHALSECKELHGDALRDLYELTSVSNTNVCSDKKITLIENYHNKYVSTNKDHVKIRLENKSREAPQVLRLFFMHYAMEVDAICKRHFINNLEWDLKEKFGHIEEFQRIGDDKKDEMFSVALEKFTSMYHVSDFEDVILFWNLIDGSVEAAQSESGEARDGGSELDFDKKTGEPIRLMAKVKSMGPMRELQATCLNKYKPIYSKLLLPIIRLADLGYTNSGEQFKVELEELKNNPTVKHWYAITQLCEAIIPMKLYEDSSLGDKDIVMITKEEADYLEEELDEEREADELQVAEAIEYEPSTNSMEQVDVLESVKTEEAQNLVKKVNTNLLAKNRSMRRAMKHIFRHLKQKFGRQIDSFKVSFSKPAEKHQFEEKKLAKPLSSSLDTLEELEPLEEVNLMKVEGGRGKVKKGKARSAIDRQKRRRKGDIDMISEMRGSQIAYRRTKTWGEIFNNWSNAISQLAPTRMQLILVGSLLIFITLIILFMMPMMIVA